MNTPKAEQDSEAYPPPQQIATGYPLIPQNPDAQPQLQYVRPPPPQNSDAQRYNMYSHRRRRLLLLILVPLLNKAALCAPHSGPLAFAPAPKIHPFVFNSLFSYLLSLIKYVCLYDDVLILIILEMLRECRLPHIMVSLHHFRANSGDSRRGFAKYRSKMRAKYNLAKIPCTDCLVHCFCEQCALCQEYKELKHRGYDPALGWKGNLDRRQLEMGNAMTPPANPTMEK